MLSPLVQGAFVIIVAWLLGLAVHAAGIPISEEVLNAVAGGIVVWLVAKFGLGLVRRALMRTRFAGLVAPAVDE